MQATHETDVAIIGGGLAGMAAAEAARTEGARVLLVDRTIPGLGTNTALSKGAFAGPTAAYDAERYVIDTLRIGRFLGRPWAARRVAADLPGAIGWLREMGLNIAEKKDHYCIVTDSGDEFPGGRLARVMACHLIERKGLARMGGTWVDRILLEDGRATGLHGYDNKEREVFVQAGAVILAAGGAGALYLRNDNQKSTLGQGYALAAGAGLALWDMEFVQYYPVVMAQARLPAMILYSPHPKGSRIINTKGENLADKHGIGDFNDAVRKRRDWLSAVLFEESKSGPIFMDYRDVPDSYWERPPLVLLKKRRFDFRSQPVAISPAVHYFMGGVRVDPNCATDVPGLFACGEVAWGLHGACRMGGNALAECLVFGRLAGKQAAGCIRPGKGDALKMETDVKDLTPAVKADPDEARKLLRQLKTLAWQHAGVVRDADGLRKGMKRLDTLTPRIRQLPVHPPARRRVREDLLSMALVLRAILAASLCRQESRGCFIRCDYPEEDNVKWLKNSRIDDAAGPERPTVSYFQAEIGSDQLINARIGSVTGDSSEQRSKR